MSDIKYQDIAESISAVKARQLNESPLYRFALPAAGAVGAKLVGDKLEDEGVVPRGLTRTLALGALGVAGAEALKQSIRRSRMFPSTFRFTGTSGELFKPITGRRMF